MDNVIEWLNENELRAYPLIEGDKTEVIPENFLLDLILVVNQSIASLASVNLLEIEITSTGLKVTFTDEENNQFFVAKNQTYPLYVRKENGSLAVFGQGVETFFNLPIGQIINCNIPVEPSTIFKFDGAWLGVSSISTNKSYESIENSYTPLTPLILNNADEPVLTQDVEFYPGYNYKINFNNDKINMAAGFKFGLAMDCTTEFIQGDLKDCDKIISYINGIPPDSSGRFRLTSGENIYIFPGTSVDEDIPDNNPKIEELYYSIGKPQINRINENSLFVGLTFLESDLCSPVQLLPTNN